MNFSWSKVLLYSMLQNWQKWCRRWGTFSPARRQKNLCTRWDPLVVNFFFGWLLNKFCQLKNTHETFERFLYKFPRCIITTITRLSTDLTKFLHNRWHFCTLSWGAQGWNLLANMLQMSQLRIPKSTPKWLQLNTAGSCCVLETS